MIKISIAFKRNALTRPATDVCVIRDGSHIGLSMLSSAPHASAFLSFDDPRDARQLATELTRAANWIEAQAAPLTAHSS